MKNGADPQNEKQQNLKASFLNNKPNFLNNYKIEIIIELIKHLSLIILFWNFVCTFNYDEFRNKYGEEIFTKPSSNKTRINSKI